MNVAQPSPPPASHELSARPKPNFWLTLRGIWLFTWKSQLTWRRLPWMVLGLLALPVLVYLTTSTPRAWAVRHSPLGSSERFLRRVSHELARARVPLQPQEQAQLRKIVDEEFARTENRWLANVANGSDHRAQDDEIRACYKRINSRAQTVLTERQFSRFQNAERRSLRRSLARAAQPRWRWTEPFYHWLIDFYFFVILPLQCVKACGALIRDELQANTLGFLTTRPISRARLVCAKYLSQTAWLQIQLFIETGLLFAVGGLRHIPALSHLVPLFLAAQFLAVFAWSALGLLLGLLTRRYIALALVYGFIVEMGIGRIPTNINNLSLIRHLKTLLAHNPALEQIYQWSGQGVPLSASALVFATAIFLAASALLFTFREYHHTAEMQK